MKKKIYCVFCGTENDSKKETCKNCHQTLTPEDHLWKDYFKGHIKDKLKDKVEDKTSSIITNYIISHLYGIAFSILFVATAVTGIVSITKKDYPYIKEVNRSPLEVVELSLDDELVQRLNKLLSLNEQRYFDSGFHEGVKLTYDNLKHKEGITYYYEKVNGQNITFSTCEEAKKYPDIYKLCQDDPSWVIGEESLGYYLFDYKNFETVYKNMYGNDKTLEKGDFQAEKVTECHYYEDLDQYICYSQPHGWFGDAGEFNKLIKAEKINNTILLYEYFVWWTYEGTYKDIKQTEKISDEIVLDNESLIEQGQLYRHIFKENENGTYHWVSSEPINSLED